MNVIGSISITVIMQIDVRTLGRGGSQMVTSLIISILIIRILLTVLILYCEFLLFSVLLNKLPANKYYYFLFLASS